MNTCLYVFLASQGFVFRKRRRLSLKGLDEPVRVFEVMRQPPPSVETAVVGEAERQGQRSGTQIDVGGRIGK